MNYYFINILIYSDEKILLDEFKVYIQKVSNHIAKLRFFFNESIDFHKFPISEYFKKKNIKDVSGYLTRSLFHIYSRETNISKISDFIIFNFGSRKNFISYLNKFDYEFYTEFVCRFFSAKLDLHKSFQRFFFKEDLETFLNFLDFFFPNLEFLTILDKEGYRYYNGGWSMTRARQNLNLLNSLNLDSNFFKDKDVMEVGPGLCDFIKIAQYCGSKNQYIIDKNPIFLILGQHIGVNEYFYFDFTKDDCENLSLPNYDILFIKGFLNVFYYDIEHIKQIVTLLTKNIKINGTGLWFTYNTYFENMEKHEYELRLSQLIKIFGSLGWRRLEFSEEEKIAAGFNYLENVNMIPFKIDK